MKTKNLYVPLSMTAALAGLIACGVSCAKKSSDTERPVSPPAEPVRTNPVPAGTNTVAATNAMAATNIAAAETAAVTNAPAPEITNEPPAETTVKAPETNEMAETNIPGHMAVVEMPTNAPVAPANFYPAANTNAPSMAALAPAGTGGNTNYFLRFRAGYEHINHGDNNDSYFVSAKFYAWGDDLRDYAGKNGWLIPDMDAEISSGAIAKPDEDPHPGSDDGLRFRADFTWPWIRWTTLLTDRTNSICPFCQPMSFRLGPTFNIGFDHLYDETGYRFARYGGVRLTFNKSGFIEYTAGGTEGLDGTRQQIVTEIPFYESRDGEVRYYLRGLWNHGANNRRDILEAGLFVEMPFDTLIRPEKWSDLIPCIQ